MTILSVCISLANRKFIEGNNSACLFRSGALRYMVLTQSD